MGDYNQRLGLPSNLNKPFTRKGKYLVIKGLGNVKVLRCKGDFADVEINRRIYLVDCNLKVVR